MGKKNADAEDVLGLCNEIMNLTSEEAPIEEVQEDTEESLTVGSEGQENADKETYVPKNVNNKGEVEMAKFTPVTEAEDKLSKFDEIVKQEKDAESKAAAKAKTVKAKAKSDKKAERKVLADALKLAKKEAKGEFWTPRNKKIAYATAGTAGVVGTGAGIYVATRPSPEPAPAG